VLEELIPGYWLLALILAVLPGVSHWWGSRPLRSTLDDPLLAERVFALQRRTTASFLGVLVILLATSRSALFAALPLLVLTRVLAAYPLRRALYEETWSVPQYLIFTSRTLIALVGFWCLLAVMPVLARLTGSLDWLTGMAVGVVLLLWNSFYASVILTLFNARPIHDEALLARLAPMAQQCGLSGVRFEMADLKGGAIVNALALASLRMRAVLFTDGLLVRLTPDETVAIGAHEIAHLEYYNPQRLRRGRLLIWSLAIGGAMIAPICRVTGASFLTIEVVWVMTLLGVLVGLAHHRQKNETDSDRRAVELTGDGEALARALTKAYAFNKYPRRLAAQVEQQATHPSLARRLRDIRSAAATSPTTLSEAVGFTAADATRVRFESDRLVWEEAGGGTHAYPYSRLTELRIDAEQRGGARLVAVDTTGRQWTFGLPDAEAGAVQNALDTVDGLLTHTQARIDRWSPVAQIVASIASVALIASGTIVGAFIAIAAAFRGGRMLFAATGAACLAAVLVASRNMFGLYSVPAILALLPAAAILLATALRAEPKPLSSQEKKILATVAAAALFSLAVIVSDGLEPVSLFLMSRSAGSGVVLTWTLAAALTFLPSGRLRRLGPVAGAIAVAVALFGTQWFVSTFGSDDLMVDGRPFELRNIDAAAEHEFTSPLQVTDLRLSRGGRAVALGVYDVNGVGEAADKVFHVGRVGGSLIRVSGNDLAFLDDQSFIVTRYAEGKIGVAKHTIDTAEASWQAEIEDLYPERLVVDPANHHWTVFGTDEDDRIVRVQGSAQGPAFVRRTWDPRRHAAYATVIATSGDHVLVVESDYDFDSVTRGPLATLLMARMVLGASSGVRWWSSAQREMSDLGRSRLSSQCFGDTYDEGAIRCLAFDGASTRFASIDASTGSVVPAGTLPGQLVGHESAERGWMSGYANARVLLVDLNHAIAFAFDRDRWAVDPTAAAGSDDTVAAAWTTPQGATVRLFRIAPTASPRGTP
jgi:Zn-dependent protease with chaperone function